MKKKVLIGIIPILVIGLFIIVWAVKDNDGTDEYRTITLDSNISVVRTEPDMRPYEIEEMIADAEVIASGTVKGDIKSYVNENGSVCSIFDFEISSVEKGDLNVNDIVSVNTYGGTVPYSEILEADRGILEEQFSSEYVDEQKAEYGAEYVESVYADIPNIQTGEQLFLFLLEPVKEEPYDYYICGSSYYGKFAYDKKSDEYYKERMEKFSDLEKSIKVNKEGKIKQKDLKDKIKKTKDNSKKLREELIQFYKNEEQEKNKQGDNNQGNQNEQ